MSLEHIRIKYGPPVTMVSASILRDFGLREMCVPVVVRRVFRNGRCGRKRNHYKWRWVPLHGTIILPGPRMR